MTRDQGIASVSVANLLEERNRGHGSSQSRLVRRGLAAHRGKRLGSRARQVSPRASARGWWSAGWTSGRRPAALGHVGRPEVGPSRPEMHQEPEETHSSPGGQNAGGGRRGHASGATRHGRRTARHGRTAGYARWATGHGPGAARHGRRTARYAAGRPRCPRGASGDTSGSSRHASTAPWDGRKNGRRSKRCRERTGGNPQR